MHAGIAEKAINKKITSADNPRLKAAVRLKSSRGRKVQRRIIIFGFREVQRAVQSGIQLLEIFVDNDSLESEQLSWIDSLQSSTTIVYRLSSRLFTKLRYGERSEGVAAVAQRPALSLSDIQMPATPLVVVLEAIEKPGNIGAVIRSADAVGASALVLADPICDPLHPNCIRASQGAAFSMQVATAGNEEVDRWIREKNLQLLVAADSQTNSYTDVDLACPTAIVLGNESSGHSNFWACHPTAKTVSIPMKGVCDSLNISVAAAVLLYEANRQRAPSNDHD